jgi:hypothetical protein
VRTARIAKCTKQSGLLATPISRSVLGASSRAHRIKCSWFNTSSCRVNAAIRCDATHARRQRLVSLPTMNVQRQPHGFHDAVRLHATLCVVCIVYRAAHGVRRTSPQKVTMLMRLPSDDPTLAILRFSLSQLAGVPIDAFCVVARSLPHTSHYCQPEVVRHRSRRIAQVLKFAHKHWHVRSLVQLGSGMQM